MLIFRPIIFAVLMLKQESDLSLFNGLAVFNQRLRMLEVLVGKSHRTRHDTDTESFFYNPLTSPLTSSNNITEAQSPPAHLFLFRSHLVKHLPSVLASFNANKKTIKFGFCSVNIWKISRTVHSSGKFKGFFSTFRYNCLHISMRGK